jgi:hypothetical protein
MAMRMITPNMIAAQPILAVGGATVRRKRWGANQSLIIF